MTSTDPSKSAEDVRHDREFVNDTEAVIRLGAMLLSSGTGSYRVKRAMSDAGRALGMDRIDATVGLTEITATAHRGDNFRTVAREVYRVRVDSSRIAALEDLAHHLPAGTNGRDLESRLDHISRTVRPKWAEWQTVLAGGVACAGFAILNKFSLADSLVVLLAASVGQFVRGRLNRRWLNQFGVAALASGAACLVYMLLADLLTDTGLHTIHGPGYVASLLFLVPGFPMITSILDMVRMDFTAGLSRATYSFGLVLAATMSAWVFSTATGLQPLPIQTVFPNPWAWLAYAVATACGVAGFAVLFNSSPRMVAWAATLGVCGNLCRLALIDIHMPVQLAAGVGGLIIGFLAGPLSAKTKLPRITLTVPACVIMLPGAAMYRTVFWLNGEDMTKALSFGVDAILTVTLIACGLAVARMCTDPAWARNLPVPSPHAFKFSDQK
ncbi:threonine/serine exporter ThrE family protein [Cutibacterium sp.]|uniref:threonine/serine ThrE exporter family protein n=1 Tax=Cutibacterium sp. TaxID=1912221 RepID=UPI0026DD749F|nr:threonine/serine exporter family protein [Cutibacterium sp.]MDO4411561.1 threonine/serine exporter family protein [Cutibacterium sp.]